MLFSARNFNGWLKVLILFIVIVCILSTCVVLVFVVEREGDGIFNMFREEIKQTESVLKHDKQFNNNKPRTLLDDFIDIKSEINVNKNKGTKPKSSQCKHLRDCFNFRRCKDGLKVYIHPLNKADQTTTSELYQNFLHAISQSKYLTNDPDKACIFILLLDTLDRDKLSAAFIKNINNELKKLHYWNNGENHIILNLFSGTWPDYSSDLAMNFGKAIIAKTSVSVHEIRQNYDISIPLLPKNHPLYYESKDSKTKREVDIFPVFKKYLLTFKGKRYLYGIGSDTRNSLHLINNDKDIICLTTCVHGKIWEKFADERCPEDIKNYERYDYNDLLANSTFCLIPRGRRLASFRLLEAMEQGCIPILLSDGWELPFGKVLDWSKFSLNIQESQLLQVPSILRNMNFERVLQMRQQTVFVWQTYFSSVSKIVHTTFEVLHDRIHPHIARSSLLWNSYPGALHIDAGYSTHMSDFPFYYPLVNAKPSEKFTAIILAKSPSHRTDSSLFTLITEINKCQYLDQILVVWLPEEDIPNKRKWPKTRVTLRVIHPSEKSENSRFIDLQLVNTDAVFLLNDDITPTRDDLDFAFSVWRSNPTQLVGFFSGVHLQNDDKYTYTQDMENTFSTVDIAAVILHKCYSHHFLSQTPEWLLNMAAQNETCVSLALNFHISHVNLAPPIKMTRSKNFNLFRDRSNVTTQCFDALVKFYGGVPPLRTSIAAMNPVLYKDPVSIDRLKYKRLV